MKQLFREPLRCAGRLPFLAVLMLACCFGGAVRPAAAAGTYRVTNTLDDGSPGTLRAAISLANADPGATVVFAPGVSGAIPLHGSELDITTSMTIIGPSEGVGVVDGDGAVRLFNITSPSAQVILSGLILQNGSAFNDPNSVTSGAGGGILNSGTLTLTGCTLSSSIASYGGGIYNDGALTLNGCTLVGNGVGDGAGGGVYSSGSLALTGCTILYNSAFYAGGLYNGGTMTLAACTVSGNHANASADGNSGAGAGLYNDGGLTLTGCVLSSNFAFGGTADNGGPGGSGGGLYNNGTLTLTGCTLSVNAAGPNDDGSGGRGGGLDNQGTATLTNDIFYADIAPSSLDIVPSSPEIANDTVDSPDATVTAAYCDIQGSSANPANFGPNLFGPTNLDADPLFVSAPSDLHLRDSSPCIGQGVADPSNATDRDGKQRSDPPSIGAYESLSLGPTVGHWTPLTHLAPEATGTMLLLTDGSVMAQGTYNGGANTGNGDNHWFKLTPDTHGSYADGTWTPMASMHLPRTYYASAVLPSGKVLVAGGEYTDSGAVVNTNAAELYDPVADAWTEIAGPGWDHIGNAPIKTLFDGTVLLGSIFDNETAIYNDATGAWAAGAFKAVPAAGESWALLPDQTVLTAIPNAYAEKYLPSGSLWVPAGQAPVDLDQNGSGKSGPAVLLPGGQCLWVGAAGHTALYTPPSDPAQPGTWQAGPDFPASADGRPLGAEDAPGCLLVNGKVLCLVRPVGGLSSQPQFFEYAPDGNGGTLTAAPSPDLFPLSPAFKGRLLALPNGQVLYSDSNNLLAVYTPSSGPAHAWKPTVTGGSINADHTFQIFGTQFNGLSEGASGGNGASMSSNYPLVRVTDKAGAVSYARTFNHSTMGLATGGLTVSTNFIAPPLGTYQLQVVANGIASDPVNFISPPGLAALTLPPVVTGGTVLLATVSLNGPAPVDTLVGLSSSDPSVVRIFRSVIIPTGFRSARFAINTFRSHVTNTVTIRATLGPSVQTATLTIQGR